MPVVTTMNGLSIPMAYALATGCRATNTSGTVSRSEIVERATSQQTADGLSCTAAEEVDATGLTLVVVRCSGSVPTLLAALGDLLPVEVTGRAVKERAQ